MNIAITRLSVMMEQATELVLIDTAELTAAMINQKLESGSTLDEVAHTLPYIFTTVNQRKLVANVHGEIKSKVNLNIYVTDHNGIVIYDSEQKHTGENFQLWRDVSKTLSGEYGARTSLDYENGIREMVIASPLTINQKLPSEKIVGVVAVKHDLDVLASTALIEAKTLRKIALLGVFVVTIVIFFMSRWLTNMMKKLAVFADTMATGAKTQKPLFLDKRLDKLADSIVNMREQIDGKAYIEQYVHSLTHELKTPITGINASVEFLQDQDNSEEEKLYFLERIERSNRRMSDLVSRVLALAKIEHQQTLTNVTTFNLCKLIKKAVEVHEYALNAKAINLDQTIDDKIIIEGDELLFSQAIANLLDNAIDFCPYGGDVEISLISNEGNLEIIIDNVTEKAVPEYVLQRAFERFFSTSRPQTNKRSTGLGLSFVKEVMSLHGYKIKVSSKSKNKLFYFSIHIKI